MRSFLDSHPLDVYAICCRLNIEEEAKLAAEVWKSRAKQLGKSTDFLSTDLGASFVPNMSKITAGAYYRLLYYIRHSTDATVRFIDGGDPSQFGGDSSLATEGIASQAMAPEQGRCLHETAGADAILVSSDGVQFPIHSMVLHLASAGKLLGDTTIYSTESPPTIPSDLHSRTLSQLLRICYPLEPWDTRDFSMLLTMYEVAHRLHISKAITSIRKQFKSFIPRCPNLLSMYFIAVEQNWKDEAQEVAEVVAERQAQFAFAPEMEHMPALTYRHVLQFCHEYIAAADSAYSRHTPMCYVFANPAIHAIAADVAMNQLYKAHQYIDNPRYNTYVALSVQDLINQSEQLKEDLTKVASQIRLDFVDRATNA